MNKEDIELLSCLLESCQTQLKKVQSYDDFLKKKLMGKAEGKGGEDAHLAIMSHLQLIETYLQQTEPILLGAQTEVS